MSAADTGIEQELAVVGAGAVGLATALGLSRAGFAVTLAAPPAPTSSGRTVALLAGSVRFLQDIDAWENCAAGAEAMRRLTLVDATDNLFRPAPVTFDCREIGLDAFGWNIELDALVKSLEARISASESIRRIRLPVTAIEASDTGVTLRMADNTTLTAEAVVGADGARSVVREALGIAMRVWDYPQSALTTLVEHDRDHAGTSTEFHTRSGPFTLVPMQGRRSAVVWVSTPGEIAGLIALPDEDLSRALSRRAGFVVGRMRVAGPRGHVPLRGLSAESLARGRGFLVGEAAHVFPPIGAQGLNLGFRDAQVLCRELAGMRGARATTDWDRAAAAYERARKPDIRLRTFAVDALDRLLLSRLPFADLARGFGLTALGSIGPLRRAVMRAGLGA